jgi:hypothetical protein
MSDVMTWVGISILHCVCEFSETCHFVYLPKLEGSVSRILTVKYTQKNKSNFKKKNYDKKKLV